MNKIREKVNIFVAKSPQKAVLLGIMLFNVVFITLAAGIIAVLSNHISGLKACSFWEAIYHTILMVLDAGCVESVIADVGKAGAFAAIVCIAVVVLGMMFFSGAVIGYITNGISEFIESKNNGKNKLLVSDHVVIINWNSRGAEIINEFLYKRKAATIVVFVTEDRERIDEEIRNRLDTTLVNEAEPVYRAAEKMPFFEKRRYLKENLLRDKITYIVREGDVAAATDLDDICISKAKTVIILDGEDGETRGSGAAEKGNTQTIKTLIQVSEISKSNHAQTILVEVADTWTEELVWKIIEFKSGEGKESIIPISFNRLLGKTHSHITVMPELIGVYDNLFSNKGAHFLSKNVSKAYSAANENEYIEKHLAENSKTVPLTVMKTMKGTRAFFMGQSMAELEEQEEPSYAGRKALLKKEDVVRTRTIVVFGHNSNMESMMDGFELLRKETKQKDGSEAIRVVMADDEENLKKHNYYRDHPFVETFAADIFDDRNKKVLESTVFASEDTTILVLSDDLASREETDANVLTYLIYIQEQIRIREKADPNFCRDRLDVIVEILNAKNEQVVRNYGADEVIISNRYLSRVISQISRGDSVVEFYAEILSYVVEEWRNNDNKEIYIRHAEDFFEEIPEKCSAYELIRMVFAAGEEDKKSLLLGYVRNRTEYVFFSGDQRQIEVELRPEDRLILFCNHCGRK